MINILFTLDGGVERYAQNPSKTFDGAFTVVRETEAKKFETARDAHKFLARHGFMKRVHRRHNATGYTSVNNMPGPFTGWELLTIP